MPALQEAAMDGSSDSHFESEKRFKKQHANGGKAPPLQGQLTFLATTDLKPDPRNPRLQPNYLPVQEIVSNRQEGRDVYAPHDGKVGRRHGPGQRIDAAAADPERLRLFRNR